MTVRVLVAPTHEPVSLAQAKKWLLIDDDIDDHDDVILLLISSMREDAENLTHRAFIQRDLRLTLSTWPLHRDWGVKIVLPQPPLVSVASVKYIDTAGVQQTLATDQYVVHDEKEPAFIVPAWNVALPTIRYVPNALQVDYTAGYPAGSPPDENGLQQNLPSKLKLWMQSKIASLFENREQFVVAPNIVHVPRDHSDALLDSLIVGSRIA